MGSMKKIRMHNVLQGFPLFVSLQRELRAHIRERFDAAYLAGARPKPRILAYPDF